ncbi:MAG: hypothetical protein IPJ76_03490 [Flavobacteriales bacterium]|nr:MAG: hypothetical protein IPJ76_03490 [Flavobacteriales bacterium]
MKAVLVSLFLVTASFVEAQNLIADVTVECKSCVFTGGGPEDGTTLVTGKLTYTLLLRPNNTDVVMVMESEPGAEGDVKVTVKVFGSGLSLTTQQTHDTMVVLPLFNSSSPKP